MKILFVSLFLPQQKAYHAGGRYVFEVIRSLSKKHEIYLATRLEEDESATLEDLKPFCKAIYAYKYKTKAKRTFFDSARLIINYAGFSLFSKRIADNGRFDLIQVEWIGPALMMKKGKTPMVLDVHDVMTKPAERNMKKSGGFGKVIGYIKYRFIRALEVRIAARFDRVFTRSENDKEYIIAMDPALNVDVVPHPAGLDFTDRGFAKERDSILFLASYKYRQINVDAALYFYRDIFPLIRKTAPDAKFIIAGYGPPDELSSLQEKDSGVLVTGFVEDIDECYKKASVFVAPILIGGGIIAKILDALAAGTPVVTTSYGNEGIGALPGRDILVADDPESFAAAVLRIFREKGLAETLSANGLEFVRNRYSLEAVMSRIESAYGELVRS
ncbi:MAG: glycosyltransferase [Nitrospirae bacterium]|nr:glycosyltransferase [Nitrospirota bacterium]